MCWKARSAPASLNWESWNILNNFTLPNYEKLLDIIHDIKLGSSAKHNMFFWYYYSTKVNNKHLHCSLVFIKSEKLWYFNIASQKHRYASVLCISLNFKYQNFSMTWKIVYQSQKSVKFCHVKIAINLAHAN